MSKKTLYSLLLLFVLSVSGSKAQKLSQFSGDTLKFIKELNDFFYDNSANKKDAETYVLEFSKKWKTAEISGGYKTIIIETCNEFLQKRLKPYPYFVSYINSMINFIHSGQSEENRENWQKCMEKILKGKSIRGFSDFLEMSENMFAGNIFYKSPSYIYKSLENNYKFEYDSIPKVIFTDFTLVGKNPRGDSIAIENTKGTYYPTWGKFVGKGGKVGWIRAGLGDDVYADIKRYAIDCKTGSYTSDSSIFYGKQYFDKPQLGKLNDRIITENTEATYPRFDSYSKRLLVKNIYPDVDYDGGFGMRGPKFVGSGNATNPAKIIFRREGKKFMEISARSFAMSKERVVANPGTVKLFFDKDSIYHPGLSFTYQVDKKTVTILRGDDGLQKTPISNSFHKFDMYFEQLVWHTEDPHLSFGFLPNNFQGEAYFESSDFYNADRAAAIRQGGTDNMSLTQKLNEYYLANGKLPFTAVDFAKYIKYLAVDLRPILFKMAIL
ncbi:MAG TPA: hypothetical protein VN026_14075, partial [Bacteroidia bacterium]|nr:hypothetical protein [Bacteroidia bacterium]